MAAVNFPNSPSNGDSHTSGGSTWTWNGTVWQRLGVAGAQGAQGVQGATGTGTGTADKIYEGNTQAEVVDPGTNGYFKVDVEGIEALRIIRKTRISSEGRVGIGTTDPDRSLVVNSDDQVVGLLSTRNTGNRSFLRFMDPSTTAEAHAPAIGSSGANLDLRTGGVGSANANRLRITGIGSVGIGTDDPVAKLDISGKTIIGIKTNYSNTLNISGSGLGVTGFRALNIIDENAVIKLSRTHDTYGSGVDFQHWNPNISTMYGRGLVGIESGSMYLMNTTEEGYIHFNTTPSGGSHTERLRITGIGSVGIGSAAPTSVLDIVAADPVLTLRDTSTTVTNANATLRLAESQSTGVIENYWDVVADTTAGNFGFAIKQNLGGSTSTRFAIQPATGNIGIAQINPQHKLHVVGDIYASDDLIAGDEIRNKVPADFWATDNTFINFNDVGNITHMGGYQTVITSNGYRDTNGQWKSNAINSNTGAAQIVLHPTGEITFGTESNKANGSSWAVDTKLRITADGKMGVNSTTPHAYLDVNTDETLSSTAGIGLTIAEFRGAVGNASQLEFKHVRLSAGSDWTTVTTRIQRKIDSTNMGYIDFGTGVGNKGYDIAFGNSAGSESLRIEKTGRVVIGHTDSSHDLHGPQTTNNRGPFVQIHGANAASAGAALVSWKNAAGSYYAPTLYLAHSGSDTKGTNGILPASGEFGSIVFSGDDGTDFVKGAMIKARLDGTPGADDMPGRLEFYTTPDGAQAPLERLRITSAGRVGIGTGTPDATLDITGNRQGTSIDMDGAFKQDGSMNWNFAQHQWIRSASNTNATKIVSILAGGDNAADTNLYNNINFVARTSSNFGAASTSRGIGVSLEITAPNEIRFSTNTAERLRISSAGDVGIGHQLPSAGLHIKRQGRNFSLNQFYDGYNSDNGLGNQSGSIAGSQTGERTHSLILESTTSAAIDRGSSIGFRAKSGDTLIDVTYAAIVGAKENSVTDNSPSSSYDDQAKGYLAFYTSNQYAYSPHYGTHNLERVRIGSAGQLGIGGANYGTSGQVLTSGGASAAPSWADAAGGMSEIDMWHLTSSQTNVSGSGISHLYSNFSRFSSSPASWTKTGTGVSVDSTGWSFPSTGVWEVTAHISCNYFKATSNHGIWGWQFTNDNGSNWNTFNEIFEGRGSAEVHAHTNVTALFTISNTSNQKIRFRMNWSGNNGGDNFKVYGNSTALRTYYIFKKLA